jgi:hypothetical protein
MLRLAAKAAGGDGKDKDGKDKDGSVFDGVFRKDEHVYCKKVRSIFLRSRLELIH